MKLLTEAQGEFKAVKAAKLAKLLAEDAFGSFAILEASDEAYLQQDQSWRSACDWQVLELESQ